MMKIVIKGKPIAKKRPRFVRRGEFMAAYNDQVTEEGRWLWEAKSQLGDIIPLEGPIKLSLNFNMPIPKSSPKRISKRLEKGWFTAHTKKPDLDNLVKFVKDCLNGYAWRDDSQVCFMEAKKGYSMNPMTIVLIEEAEGAA